VDKHLIRIEINNLMDAHCENCEIIKGSHTPNARINDLCEYCPHYKQIRQLGDQLLTNEGDNEMALLDTLTAAHFAELNKTGKTRKAIANKYGVALSTLNNWATKHKEEIKEARAKLTGKPGQKKAENGTNVIKKAPKTDENEQKVKEQESVIAKLRVSLAERDRQVDALIADKKRLLDDADAQEAFIADLKKESQIAQETIKSMQNDLDAFKKALNDTAQDIEEVGERAAENERLKDAFDAVHKNYEAKCRQVDDLNAAANHLENEIAELKKYKDDADQSFAYAQQQLDKLQCEHKEMDVQLAAAEDFIVALLDPRM
jgi:transposase